MNNFALVIFKKEEKQDVCKKNLIKYLISIIFNFFKKPKLKDGLKKIELYNDMNAYILKLPFNREEAIKKAKEINEFLREIITDNEITSCILPEKILAESTIEGYSKGIFCGKFLFKSLLINILDEIYLKRGIKIGDLDILIIQGKKSFEELYAFIGFLLPLVKYITVITDKKEMMEKEADKIYIDTGLSIRVTSEHKNSMKSAEVVINLGDNEAVINRGNPSPKSVLFNFGDLECYKILTQNTIVNGIGVELPWKVQSKFDDEVYQSFSKLELTEIILSHKTGKMHKIVGEIFDFETAEAVSREFKKEGFTLTNLIGRHNTFKIQDMIL